MPASPSYLQILWIVLPIFLLIAAGFFAQRIDIVAEASEPGLVRLVVNLLYPCFVFDSVSTTTGPATLGRLLVPMIVGFALTSVGVVGGWGAGRTAGLPTDIQQRSFAMAVGIANYSYMPLVIVGGMFAPQVRSVLFLYNVGVEAAIWTVGVMILTGHPVSQSWRRLVSPIIVALILAVVVAQRGCGPLIPHPITGAIHSLGGCAVPLGIFLAGVNLSLSLRELKDVFDARTSLTAVLLRLAVLPALWLAVARFAPVGPDLRAVLIVQAAMPTAMISMVAIRLYRGDALVAARVLLGTTALALVLTPLWIQAGLMWTKVEALPLVIPAH